ncbi:MAG TPA: restriction endonuclease, partial [Mycobacterium sp.]|nr:restriction endonuclease [Mycobacterium sp.]
MDTFDLARLTDFDFELVCKDLFGEILHFNLEVFGPGADGGVDLRHMSVSTDKSTIIQCKHWVRSGRAALIRHMERSELPKV